MSADTEYQLLVLNGKVVTEEAVLEQDIAIRDGKVARLGVRGAFKNATATRTIDAQGALVTPGGIDAHVHLEEPALFGKGRNADTFSSGSRSAICGGTTTIIPFAPQTRTEDTLLDILKATHDKARGKCFTDYSFHLIVSNPSENVLSEFPILRKEGISSLKIYMTYESLQLKDGQVLDVLLESRRNGITTMVHAENHDMILWMTKKLEERKLFAPKYHVTSHAMLAETEATYRAVCMSELVDAPILLVHVSSPAACEHIRTARKMGLHIYGETCPQYVFLTRDDLDKEGFEGAKACCSPPPRSKSDHEAIWKGMEDGTFAILSSDHCPFLYDDTEIGKKSVLSAEFPVGHFKHIPNGIPGVETRLPLVMSEGRLNPSRFVELTSATPAKLYGLYPQKGALQERVSDADLVIWYPEGAMEPFKLKNEMLHHSCDNTPYEGRILKQWPRYTVLRGEVVWDRDGGGLVGAPKGQFLHRGPNKLQEHVQRGEWDVEKW